MSLKNFIETSLQSFNVKAESAAPTTSYLTNGLVVTWGAMTFNQIMMLIGTVLALATFAVNLHFQKRRDKREQEFHSARMTKEENRIIQNKDVGNTTDG